jgi:hypothetical protein
MLDTILRRFEAPDEVRRFPKGRFEVVRIAGTTLGRATPLNTNQNSYLHSQHGADRPSQFFAS